jgi:hypothetical protein
VYDPSGPAVTLLPRRRLSLRRLYQLTVIGTPPGGLAGPDGTFLDGSGSGQPGSDFTATLLGFGAVGAGQPGPATPSGSPGVRGHDGMMTAVRTPAALVVRAPRPGRPHLATSPR